MKRIESFKINHLVLERGLYVSRRDSRDGAETTTFDLRLTLPNREPPADMPALHTIEHLGATFLRSHERAEEIIYFGPMGCRTGFYLVMFGKLSSEDVYTLVIEMCDFILSFAGDIPGATAKECGNYLEQNLTSAKYYIAKYKSDLEKYKNFTYKE
ncbi:MAG: S-ribosylhomocysteine lyase [Clostridiales bacterium]|nr:S-ribosylhomocysteine lyase [Clostridiales bacterium]